MWSIYLLWHPEYKRTYIGCSVDVKRRLKQHNKEIKGGSKSTAKYAPGWTIFLELQGFKNRSEAMRWEKIVKMRAVGLALRALAFKDIAEGKCPTNTRYNIYYKVPNNIKLLEHKD